jgi:hypothetical protein
MSDERSRRSTRLNLIAIATVGLLPFVGSYLLYWLWKPDAFVNYGELLAVPLPELQAQTALPQLKGKWAFLMVDSGACDDWCRRKLYIMRQVRLTQGKDMERVERVWLVDDALAPSVALVGEYAGTYLLQAPGSALLAKLPAVTSARDHVYLVDPLGNLVLRYPRDADPSRVKKDLSRLLRASRIGRG